MTFLTIVFVTGKSGVHLYTAHLIFLCTLNIGMNCFIFIDYLDPCKLFCLASGHKFYAKHKNQVRDGTPCGKDYSKVCIQGNCQVRVAVLRLSVKAIRY